MKKRVNVTAKNVEKQIAALSRMNLQTLRATYRKALGKDTAARSAESLRRRLAARLRELAGGEGTSAKKRDPRLPDVGKVLEREHGGTIHKVTVLENGFLYGGKTYGSLSTVAKAISSVIWNGYVFFGRALKEAS